MRRSSRMSAWSSTTRIRATRSSSSALVADVALAVDDLPDLDGSDAGGPEEVEAAVAILGRDRHDHADPHVEDLAHLVGLDAAEALDLPEDPRRLPGALVDDGVCALGQHPHEVARDAPAGDVG